jgi:S-adenosylmethionine hydrolase
VTPSDQPPPPIFLFTDFGGNGPYVGQMKAAIHRIAPTLAVVDLCHDVAPFQARPAAHLLAALLPHLPAGACVVAVVDPGVGTARRGVLLEADGIRLVGPDNGLLAIAALRAKHALWRYLPAPAQPVSTTFHGRDWFGPVAARLQSGQSVALGAPADEDQPEGMAWPVDWNHVIYVDGYGNAMTGLRAEGFGVNDVCLIREDMEVRHARTFGEVPRGAAFWYANSCSLVELAVNQGHAARELDLRVGQAVEIRRLSGSAQDAT